MNQVELEIPARPEFVSVARLVVGCLAGDVGFAEDRIDDLRLAVSEACTNAIEAHDAARTDQRVKLSCRVEPDALVVDIEDRGLGFDPDHLGGHPPVTDPDRLHYERGLGIPLIRSLVDVARFTSTGSGTTVHLELHREPVAAAAETEA